MNAQVFVLSGPRQGETITILQPPFLVGNVPEDDFYVDPTETPEAAGRKLRLDFHEEGWELVNLGHGEVMVNQEVVAKRCRLRSGDVIRISAAGPELKFSRWAPRKRQHPRNQPGAYCQRRREKRRRQKRAIPGGCEIVH